jgi:hypothetical protein
VRQPQRSNQPRGWLQEQRSARPRPRPRPLRYDTNYILYRKISQAATRHDSTSTSSRPGLLRLRKEPQAAAQCEYPLHFLATASLQLCSVFAALPGVTPSHPERNCGERDVQYSKKGPREIAIADTISRLPANI